MFGRNDPLAFWTAGLAAASGPLVGEYAPILVGALFGGFVAVSKLGDDVSRLESAKHLMRDTFVAIGITSVVAILINALTGIPAQRAGFFGAFIIAWCGEQRMVVARDRIIDACLGWIGRKMK